MDANITQAIGLSAPDRLVHGPDVLQSQRPLQAAATAELS